MRIGAVLKQEFYDPLVPSPDRIVQGHVFGGHVYERGISAQKFARGGLVTTLAGDDETFRIRWDGLV